MSQASSPARARWAAVGALAAVLATLGVAAFALIEGDVWRVVVALLALAVSVVGSWYALTRRGLVRIVGCVIAACGIGALVAVIVTGPFKGLPVAIAILLAVASAIAGGYALRAEEQPPEEKAPAVNLRETPRRAVLLMNPKSGGGKVVRFDLPGECRARGIKPVVLSPGDDLESLAREAIEGGADVVGMAGGDGSQALVASVAAQHDVPFVCIPAGTRNHLALDLGIDRDDVVGALDGFNSGLERRVDLATVNGRVFVNNASMGLYAKIVQSSAYREAKLKTATDMLPDLLGPDAEPFDLHFVGPDGTQWPYAHMLLVSNNPYQLDQLLGSGKRPRMDTGNLGVAAARIDGAGQAVAFISLEAAGRIRSFNGWKEWDTPRFTVDSNAPIEVGIDGEAMTLDPPLTFESRPSALRVRLPPSVTRASTASRPAHITPETISSLVAIAAGRA
jgi:diacylglycerol kinase family enzyme